MRKPKSRLCRARANRAAGLRPAHNSCRAQSPSALATTIPPDARVLRIARHPVHVTMIAIVQKSAQTFGAWGIACGCVMRQISKPSSPAACLTHPQKRRRFHLDWRASSVLKIEIGIIGRRAHACDRIGQERAETGARFDARIPVTHNGP